MVIAGGIDLSTAAIYAITGVLAVKAANLTSVPGGFLAGGAAGAASTARTAAGANNTENMLPAY